MLYADPIFSLLWHRCHKDSVTACVLVYAEAAEPEVRKKEFATHKRALGNLQTWLHSLKVTHVAMESTGVYWKPVWQALEGKFDVTLANPYQIKAMPGRKTDARDSQWIAELLAHGLIRRSFVPPRETRQLRDLTRYRVKLVEKQNRIHNRIHKVLEDACIKLDTVASDILGVSGRRIIRAILKGCEHPADLAYEARGTLRGKMPDAFPQVVQRVTSEKRNPKRYTRCENDADRDRCSLPFYKPPFQGRGHGLSSLCSLSIAQFEHGLSDVQRCNVTWSWGG